LEVPSLGLVDDMVSFLLPMEFVGFDRGLKNTEGIAQSEIAQPRAWERLSRMVECEVCEARCLLANGSQ
jgi:hypothetical protein